MSLPKPKLLNHFKQFAIEGTLEDLQELKIGHIHKTYLGTWKGGIGQKFIHQELNDRVFSDIPSLMENLSTVLHELAQCREKNIYSLEVPELVPTKKGATYLQDDAGSYWRTFSYIENTITFDVCKDTKTAFEAGKCFGAFHRALSNIAPSYLKESIPFFMDGKKRLESFFEMAAQDPMRRMSQIRDVVSFLEKHQELATLTQNSLLNGSVPYRAVHGDMKLNNLLFDLKSGKGRAVVDLDTCMPGTILYDFGDLARTVVTDVPEDEQDLSKIVVKKELFSALSDGYLSSTKAFLAENESKNLLKAPAAVTMILGIRFLTDYIGGDTYFRIHRKDQNLDRARAQFKVVQEMLEKLN